MKLTTCRACRHAQPGPDGPSCTHPAHVVTVPDLLRDGEPVTFPQACLLIAARIEGECPHHEEE